MLIGVFVLFCALQVLYWPLIAKPEFISWWQFYPLVEIGKYIAWPALAIGIASQSFYISFLASIVWGILVGVVVYKLSGSFREKQ